jgi:hypothetical protein
VPQTRLSKLGRKILRRGYRGIWGGYVALFAAYVAYLAIWIIFDREILRALMGLGLPRDLAGLVPLVLLIVALVTGLMIMRKAFRRQLGQRIDFDAQCHLTLHGEGVHIARRDIEYLLKWNGINLLFREPDGFVLMHGALGFLVPDAAFPDEAERDTFFRTVFQHMDPHAQSRSQKEVRDAFA